MTPEYGPQSPVHPDGPASAGHAWDEHRKRAGAPSFEEGSRWLAERYAAYRRRQGARLLSLVPREAVRPLYRAALERAAGADGGGRDMGDVIALLTDFCSELLPLPPFDVWLEDFTTHRAAHLDEQSAAGERTAPERPVTVETRSFEDERGAVWHASLAVRRGGGSWRGTISFHPHDGGRAHTTGEVFVETDATTVRSRFLDFGPTTLRAFLRSVLP